jgi:copper chaperone CopZ
MYLQPMKKTALLLAPLLLLLGAGCFRSDICTEVFHVNNLHTAEEAGQIRNALHAVPGVQDVRARPEKQTLTVVYDARATHLKNIEAVIVKAGFDLSHWPALDQDQSKTEDGGQKPDR